MSPLDIDAQRQRWRRWRRRQGLVLDAGDKFALGGLGGYVDDLDLRILILPNDPEADVVPLDDATLTWLQPDRDAPYGGAGPHWGAARSTSSALIRYTQYVDDRGWVRYLALHRHGGIEIGSSGLTYTSGDARAFLLRHCVALAWIATALQAEAIAHWQAAGAFELSVALRNTRGAILAGFAEGWAEPGHGLHRVSRCLEDHVLSRLEFDATFSPEDLAMRVGDRIEQAFGATHRRYLANRGQFEGRFDARFGF